MQLKDIKLTDIKKKKPENKALLKQAALENNMIARRFFQLEFLFRSLPTLWRLNEKIYFVSDLSPKSITYIVHWLSKTHDLYSHYYYFSPSKNTKRRRILRLPFLFLWTPVKAADYIRVRTDMYVWNDRNWQDASMLTNEFVFCKYRCGGKEVSLSKT